LFGAAFFGEPQNGNWQLAFARLAAKLRFGEFHAQLFFEASDTALGKAGGVFCVLAWISPSHGDLQRKHPRFSMCKMTRILDWRNKRIY
jgi:hypothetical protein